MPSVARLNVTPVKSTALQHPNEIRLERYGAVGDRDFFVVGEDGRRLPTSAKAPLIPIRSSYDPSADRLELRLPDGIVVAGPAEPGGEALTVDFYGRRVPAHVLEGDFEEALTRYLGRPVRIARVDAPGSGIDVRAVTLISLASVDELSRQGGRSERLDPGRFRMLIEIEGAAAHEEDSWTGRRVRIGEAVVEVDTPVPRCAVTTLDPETGLRDFPTLSVIKRYRGVSADGGLPFGVYGDVVRPGRVRVGDPVELEG